jgi:gliding motility-associated-like protein
MENRAFFNKRVWGWFVACCLGFSINPLFSSPFELTASQGFVSGGTDPVIFTFNCLDGQPGDTICIPVTVENFTLISIFQFEIFWDSDVLDFIDVQNPGSPSINLNADFNLSGPNSLKVIPLNFPIDGETQPDGTVLFEVCFRIIGIPGSTSWVGISPYFDFEAVNAFGAIPVDSIGCQMTVDNAVDLVGFINSCGPAVEGADGIIDLTVYGGMAPYTITWLETVSGTPGGPQIIPTEGGNIGINVPEGNYDILITDVLGQMVSYNIDVDSLALTVGTRLRHPTCYKFDNGTMWIKPSGGSAPYSYIWQSMTDPSLAGSGFIRDPGDSSLVTSLPDGTYNVLVKDENGCESEITVVLNDNPFVFTVNQLQDATCEGVEDGFISVTISGATPDVDGNYVITTEPGFEITHNTVVVFHSPGTWSITVEDEVSQCDTVFEFTIGSLTTITANITVQDPPCFGGNDGSVSLRGLTNGVPGPSYSYTIYNSMNMVETNAVNIGGIFNYSPLAPGDYTVIITEGGCVSDSIHFTIGEPLPMTVSLVGTSLDDCHPLFETGSAWFSIMGGTGPYILDAGMGFQDADTIFDLNRGNYILTVTDDDGCTATLPFTIMDASDTEEEDITFQINGIPCEDGSTVTALYQGGAFPPGSVITWSNNMTGVTIPIDDPDTLSLDVFISSIHCILNDTVIINCQQELELDITVINPSCNDAAVGGPYTGTVIVDTSKAVAPVTWMWSFGETTNSGTYAGLAPGKYYVTVTDAVDSTAIDSFEIIAPPALDLIFGTPDSTSCNGLCDGGVMITPADGDPSLDYFLYWTTAIPNADTGVIFQVQDLCQGMNLFSVSQDGICFYEHAIEIFAPEPVEIELVSSTDATCYGYSDGGLEVVASGGSPGYTYNWVGGPSSPVYNGIAAGEYFVSATDSKNCSSQDSFTIIQPDTLIAQIDSSGTLHLSCGASNDGIVTVDVSGGNNGGYSFQWNPDVSSSYQAVNLAAGHYLITVTDPMGCSDTTSYTLTSPPPIIVEWPEVAPPACFGDETVLQIENVTGGNGNYTFNINGGELFEIGDPVLIPSGIFIVSVSDDRGCSTDTTYMIVEPNPILVSIGPDDPIIDLGDSLFLSGHVDQSDNPIAMMQWTSTVPVSCPTCDGTWVFNFLPTVYTWTVTDVNGCQGSASITVGVDFDRDIYVPSVFSPNNDGYNDDFRIYTGLGVASVNYFHIFDRWGNMVHSETNLLPGQNGSGNWDGTYNGEPLGPGVYVYVAEIQFIDNDTKLLYKGDITLIK